MTKQLSPGGKSQSPPPERRRLIRRTGRMNKRVYLMAVPVIVYFFIFNYIPMGGILMAFEDYSIKKGIFGSTFVGFDNFIRFFNSIYCWRVIRNTLLISLYGLLFSFPSRSSSRSASTKSATPV